MKRITQIKYISCYFAFYLLAGCSTSYKSPATQDVAYLRVAITPNSLVGNTGVTAEHLSSKDCRKADRSIIAFLNGTYVLPGMPGRDHAVLGIPGAEKTPLKHKHEFKIKANESFTFLLKRPFPGPSATAGTVVLVESCVTAASFIPEVGAQYEAIYDFNYYGCTMSVSKINKTKNELDFTRTPVNAEKLDCKL
jgi:hypothetical protein